MQIGTSTSDDGGMCFIISYGPTRISVIFDVGDEDLVIETLQKGFADARNGGNGRVLSD